MRIKLAVAALLTSACALAEPTFPDIMESAQSSWVEPLIAGANHPLPLDEQIFTELSPIVDSADSVALPEDQRIAE